MTAAPAIAAHFLLTVATILFAQEAVNARPLSATPIEFNSNPVPLAQVVESIEANSTNTTTINTRGPGQTGESCKVEADCQGTRKCVTIGVNGVVNCASASLVCICFDLSATECKSNAECEAGEACYTVPAQGSGSDSHVCMSKDASDKLGLKERSDSCVDARALKGFRSHQLVFKEHRMRAVLCDDSGSCATPGHMVVFRGRGMMMRSYCEHVGCEETRMLVNSPKFRRGLRVKSVTGGLEYSAFAARYESPAEEMALSAAIRVGL